ncbi:MAG TPA: DUF2891 domain-containing protein [Candidatus Krumholzibacteria bacterium]|nr:DUF2891 domain-containing protein [Candidatus Krumholzibacteria bacterium]HPD72904.1 DUF2891 domain-containing protein [Candidatus Krumholzibacteria bacterium]HRY41703.1 DUF2891 domain-containing protein [Candidatus Krumholzibacteria bacterium]
MSRKPIFVPILMALAFTPAGRAVPAAEPNLSADQAARFVGLALDCVDREYPGKIDHSLRSAADTGTPAGLHPAFFGCYDWHSAVHGHWLMARFARLHPEHPLAAEALAALDRHLRPELIAAEVAYLETPGRAEWERPYGLAWLLQLATELREWDPDRAGRWAAALAPLEEACVARLQDWLPKLTYPIRTGEHSQTALAFALVLDHARSTGRGDLARLVEATTTRLYLGDRGADLAFEPSGQDFVSPALAEADLLRRILAPAEFARWLADFLPAIPDSGGTDWLPAAVVSDRSDGKLAHLDGLNLSRAWMLRGIAAGLPVDDLRRAALLAAARAHADVGLAALTGEFYEGGHWLGTFAMYLTSDRGLATDSARN